MSRYDDLLKVVDRICKSSDSSDTFDFLEVGTNKGDTVCKVMDRVRKNGIRHFNYIGFDLFELLDSETSIKEFNGKSMLPMAAVTQRISRHSERLGLVSSYRYFAGNTHQTIPAVASSLSPVTLVFIDGGHSLPTILSDFNSLLPVCQAKKTSIIFDDYYHERTDVGAKTLIDYLSLHPHLFSVSFLPSRDKVEEKDLTTNRPTGRSLTVSCVEVVVLDKNFTLYGSPPDYVLVVPEEIAPPCLPPL